MCPKLASNPDPPASALSVRITYTHHHAQLITSETLLYSSSPSTYQVPVYLMLLQGYYRGGNVKFCLKVALGPGMYCNNIEEERKGLKRLRFLKRHKQMSNYPREGTSDR